MKYRQILAISFAIKLGK